MKLKYHRGEIKNAFFLPKIGNVKKGAPLRRGLASPRIDATLNVDSTPCPNGDRAALRILEGLYQNDTKTVFLLSFCVFPDAADSSVKRGFKTALVSLLFLFL